jgi:hypothetical protein
MMYCGAMYTTRDGKWLVDVVELTNTPRPRHSSDPYCDGAWLRVREVTPHGLISAGYAKDIPSLAKYFDPAWLVKV